MGNSAPMAEPARILTSLVGSYAQPDWLIDREKLRGRFPPRVRARELWRVDPAYLEEAQDDATRAGHRRPGARRARHRHRRRDAARELLEPLRHRARRASTSTTPAARSTAAGIPTRCPRVVGPIARRHPVQVRDLEFLRAHTSRRIKMTVPGPFTMSQQAQDDHYGDPARAGSGLRRRRERGDRGSVRGGRRHRPGRRALHAGAARAGARVRARRAAARARRHRRHDRRAHLLRLRGDHPRAAERLLVPARAGRHRVRPGEHRDRAVQASTSSVLDSLPGKTIVLGVLDLYDRRGRDAGDRRRPDQPRASRTQAASA